jgi:integrase
MAAEEAVRGENQHQQHYKGTRSRNKPVQEFCPNDFALDRKIKEEACKGLKPADERLLLELRDEDKELIADFIIDWSNQYGNGFVMSPATKRGYITSLVYLSRYLEHKKSFREMAKQDIVDGYLRSLKRSFAEDPEQKWINTYNTRVSKITTFWKWLMQPDLSPEERQIPPQLKGLGRPPRRKSKTRVKHEDLWTYEEHKVFLDRCEDPRLACYHAIAIETGGRPSELLALKIKDIQIKISPSTGKKYAEFWIGQYGKSKKARPVTISDAIPHFNVWKAVHPNRDDPHGDAYLFPSLMNRAKYRNKPLDVGSLRILYDRTISEQFPKLLLQRPEIPLEDKAAIKRLLKKPHYPYLQRHGFATEIAPKVPQYVFNQLMGHSKGSQLQDVYVNDLGTEGNRELQIAKGLITREETVVPAKLELQPKYCPICHEANKHNADFCFKCNWVISKKGMQEVRESDAKALEEAEQTKRELQELKAKQEEAARKQQMDIERITAALEKNANNQVSMIYEMLSKINKEEAKTTGPVKDFLLRRLGVLTNGKDGEDPNTGIVVIPFDPELTASKHCVVCDIIDEEKERRKREGN